MGGPADESICMSTPRLGYRPGLDGIRAVAVGMVLVHHLGYPTVSISWITGSLNIGVDVFFVLSGFLITRLLLDEQVASGTISLGRFWLRRALRLLPLAVFVIAAVWMLAAVFPDLFFHRGASVSITRDAIAALTYHMNVLVAIPGQYHVSALTHTWSLSVEEQFYFVWPVIVALLARFRPRHVSHAVVTGIAAGVVVIASSITRFATWVQADRVYNSLDSRGPGLCRCMPRRAHAVCSSRAGPVHASRMARTGRSARAWFLLWDREVRELGL